MRILKPLLLAIAVVFVFVGTVTGAQARKIDIIISKVGQKMTVKIDGRTEYVWPVSTGAAGYDTPSGTFRPFRMEEDYFSREWDNAPMPNAIFFTARGHAIHGSYAVKSLGRRASHGCVRLSPDNAKILFGLVGDAGMNNTSVTIKGGFFEFGYSPRRSFAAIGDEMDKTIGRKFSKPWWTPGAAGKKADTTKATKKPKTVAEKCAVKDGKKSCAKPAKPAVDVPG